MSIERYELNPVDGRKSFYGKCYVEEDTDTGDKTLYSYNTKIITKKSNGELIKYWDDWSSTTGRHIKAFCGLDKKGYEAL